jgi:exodeoxyribonuclease-5
VTAFKPTEQQASALDMMYKRIEAGEPESRLFGYAGTGKTTIAHQIALQMAGQTLFAAFTGKAASVLTRKGCPATTIHSLIYLPTGDKQGEIDKLTEKYEALDDVTTDLAFELSAAIEELEMLKHKPGFVLNPGSVLAFADLLIVDEVSMVDKNLASDLLAFGVPIIALGDPAQLPPVGSGGYFTKGGESVADAMLTDVRRQAEGGDIIELATSVRNTRGLPKGNDQVVRQISRSGAMEADQILVGKNATRWSKNLKMRKLLGRDGEVLSRNEKIICLENNKNLKCMNGQMFIVQETHESKHNGLIEALLICDCDGFDPSYPTCSLCKWTPKWLPLHIGGFLSEEEESRLKVMPYGKKQAAMYATYGYAITVHKAQGSEWKNVVLFDESAVFRKDGWRWLYTGITRASEGLVVVS